MLRQSREINYQANENTYQTNEMTFIKHGHVQWGATQENGGQFILNGELLINNDDNNIYELSDHARNAHIGYEKDCLPCKLVNVTARKKAHPKDPNEREVLETICSDIKVIPTDTPRKCYLLTFVDMASRFARTFPLNSKASSEIRKCFELYKQWANAKLVTKLRTLDATVDRNL